MDPVTVLSLVETCGALAVSASKLAIGLKALAENYKQAAMTFRSVSTQCNLFACSVRAIEQWMANMPDGHVIDPSIEDQLVDSLACASDVIGALEAELKATSGADANTFWKRTRVIWNQQAMRELEDSIVKQISGISVILQVMNPPTRQKQIAGLKQRDPIFRESRASATFVVYGAKSAEWQHSNTVSLASTTIARRSQLPKYDTENALRNSRAYLRSRQTSLAFDALHNGAEQSYEDAETCLAPPDISALPVEHHHAQWEEKYLDLPFKYAKVKRYYFEVESQRQVLEQKLHMIRHLATKSDTDIVNASIALDEPGNSAELHSQIYMLRRACESMLSRNEEILKVLEDQDGEVSSPQHAMMDGSEGRSEEGIECGADVMQEMQGQQQSSVYEQGFCDQANGIARRECTDDAFDLILPAPAAMI